MDQQTDYRTRSDTQRSDPPPLPAFPKRFWMILFQTESLFKALAVRPVWFSMLAFTALLSGITMFLIPAEAWEEMLRTNMPAGQGNPMAADWIPLFSAFGAMVTMLVGAVVLSCITYVIFVFFRGDEATFKQHLSVISHSGIIMMLGAIALLPFRIASLDPQFSFSVGTFLSFLPEGGYLHNVLMSLDLFSIWAAVIAGLGISVLDQRRRWAPTATVLIGLVVVVSLVVGIFR